MWALAVGQIKAQYGPVGFVNVCDDGLDGITGGMGGAVVRVNDREQLAHYAGAEEPYTIVVEGRLTGKGLNREADIIEVGSNKTIVGVKGAELAGIGLSIRNQKNIIIRNLIIHHADPDGIAARQSHHIWVDHCEVYSQDEPRREDWDGLIDMTSGSSYITVSYCYLHDHHKACLLNSGTGHAEDNGRNRGTYHHNVFERIDQRCPRVGYGLAHVFCNRYTDIGSYAIGFHTQARVRSECNVFDKSVKRPFQQMYARSLDDASCAFLTDSASLFGKPLGEDFKLRPTGTSFDPAWWYDSHFALDETLQTASHSWQAGPVEGIENEPILWPGNGATGLPTNLTLRHSAIAGMTGTEVLFGTSPDRLTQLNTLHTVLEPATTYYWQVTAFNATSSYRSPLHRFTTAKTKATKPTPADGEQHAHLRTAAQSQGDTMTLPAPLCWHRSANAKAYRVYLATHKDSLTLLTTTNATTCQPGWLRHGRTYYWRVDTELDNGQVATGDVWTFATPCAPISIGRTETEHLVRSVYAYVERPDSTFFRASNDSVTVGEAGPGSLSGIWQGPDGSYRVSIAFYDEVRGQAAMSLSVNDKPIDRWTGSKTKNGITTHHIENEVQLHHGDELRLDFCTEGKMRCRIDYIDIVK
jgi:pectate lyase